MHLFSIIQDLKAENPNGDDHYAKLVIFVERMLDMRRNIIRRLSHSKDTAYGGERWYCDMCHEWSPVGAVGPNSIDHDKECPLYVDMEV